MKKLMVNFLVAFSMLAVNAQEGMNRIRLNQIGFYPFAEKMAIVTGKTDATTFYLLDKNSDTVFRGLLGNEIQSRNSSTITKLADFTAWQREGSYRLIIDGLEASYPFTIKPQIFAQVAKASIKGFYYQRVSMPLEEKYAGKWARVAGHSDTAILIHASASSKERPEGTIISSPGGWYDAGDYNKYIVNSGITMGTLLAAYEDFKPYFDNLRLNIPTENSGVADLLTEILVNLRWMLTMQDPYDGGVYHKCTNAAFDGMVMPGITKAPRYVVQKGTAATLDFAAVMAQASRVLSTLTSNRTLLRLADSCADMALYAWQWAEAHPDVEYDQDYFNKFMKPAITTGEYGDRNFSDEKYWAAAELYITTKKEKFLKVLINHSNENFPSPSWANVGMLGYYSLIRFEKSVPAAGKLIQLFKKRIIQKADSLVLEVGGSAFHTVMGGRKKDFVWGSNAVAANQGILLLNAYQITQQRNYISQALGNLDYLLGRNATGFCFVTGFGQKSPLHPHHRPSVADQIDQPVPGLLVGGPNPGMQDKCHYEFIEPETAYTDIDCAYASNEIAINWNAPLVYLVGAIEALQYRAGYSGKKNQRKLH